MLMTISKFPMTDLIELSKPQILMGFVASCVESVAKRLNIDTATMYNRMDKVGMIVLSVETLK